VTHIGEEHGLCLARRLRALLGVGQLGVCGTKLDLPFGEARLMGGAKAHFAYQIRGEPSQQDRRPRGQQDDGDGAGMRRGKLIGFVKTDRHDQRISVDAAIGEDPRNVVDAASADKGALATFADITWQIRAGDRDADAFIAMRAAVGKPRANAQIDARQRHDAVRPKIDFFVQSGQRVGSNHHDENAKQAPIGRVDTAGDRNERYAGEAADYRLSEIKSLIAPIQLREEMAAIREIGRRGVLFESCRAQPAIGANEADLRDTWRGRAIVLAPGVQIELPVGLLEPVGEPVHLAFYATQHMRHFLAEGSGEVEGLVGGVIKRGLPRCDGRNRHRNPHHRD
jgi:hypothetical protein